MEGVGRASTFITGETDRNYPATNAPRQCQLVLLEKLRWREGMAMGKEEGKML
jgi:hypothetical protein